MQTASVHVVVVMVVLRVHGGSEGGHEVGVGLAAGQQVVLGQGGGGTQGRGVWSDE